MKSRLPMHWRALSPRLREQATLAGWGPPPEFLQRIVHVQPAAGPLIERALATLADGETDFHTAARAAFRVIDGGVR